MPLIVVWLVAGGVFFTVYLRFINIRGFMHAIRVVSGRYKTPGDPGEVLQFQALTTAVSGTVGIGNIAGVAVAISIGGPGATFWLIVSGLLGMSTKFAECTLGVLYRRDNPDGSVSGGPMYYLERGLAERRWPRLGKALGTFYAASMVIGCLGIGSMFQSNQATAIVVDVTGSTLLSDNAWLVGATFAVLVGLVIVGGIKSIASTTVRLVPTMALLYVVSALVIIALNADRVPAAFVAIWNGAFAPEGVAGGIIGVIIIGFRRAVFSNEAGLGSAAIAHATARTPKPVSEGFVALLEPFIDTVVICTMTALVIITTVYDPALANGDVSGVELTHARLRVDALLVSDSAGDRHGAVRVLDDDRLGLLRSEGLHLPRRRGPRTGSRLQDLLLPVRDRGLEHHPRRAGGPVRRAGVRGRDSEPHRAVPDGAGGEAGTCALRTLTRRIGSYHPCSVQVTAAGARTASHWTAIVAGVGHTPGASQRPVGLAAARQVRHATSLTHSTRRADSPMACELRRIV